MSPSTEDGVSSLADRHVLFVGKLGGLTKREARNVVRQHGGIPVDRSSSAVDLIVIGADELPIGQADLLGSELEELAAQGRVEIITETQLWARLGLVENEEHVRRLYTPSMLADLLQVPIAIIRRWHRRGLIVPVREVHRLPYFDFQEIATARRLAELLAAGASPTSIEKTLADLARIVPEIERPLAQLSVIVEGRELLLRQGEGLIELGGQKRFDFEASEREPDEDRETVSESAGLSTNVDMPKPGVLRFNHGVSPVTDEASMTPDEMLNCANALEDTGDLRAAIQVYRTLLMVAGPRAEICFVLAELLYRTGDLTAARERYYAAIELDEDFVEARANLGCVLAETHQYELAIAAFQGALEHYPDYPDVHFHLARTLDEVGRTEESEDHWHRFLELSPDSPWADEARQRVDITED